MADPLPAYTVWFRDLPACPCLAEWLPWFERMAVLRGIVRESIDIAQLIGGASKSGGTHLDGGAADLWQHTWETQELARTMGAAAFVRLPPAFDPHTHLVLVGCPHNGPARYQIAALADGFNGLGTGGRGGRDTGPGTQHPPTWRDGIEWAKTQLEDDVAAEDVWQHMVTERDDKTETTERSAEFLLADAHRRAGDAARSARRAERAVEAIGKALGPEVHAAVQAALADAVVDVNVTVGGGESK